MLAGTALFSGSGMITQASILAFVIKAAVAPALKIRVGHLLAKLLAGAASLRRPLQPAGAMPVLAAQALPQGGHIGRVVIQPDAHG